MDWFREGHMGESLLRWIHVVAGVAWIGHLYFFNWVNAQFAPTMDGETKKKVVPELMPRALWWFRWGAAFTWVTGLLLVGLVYYMGPHMWKTGEADWSAGTLVLVALAWLAPLVYDAIFRWIKDGRVAFAVGLLLAAAMVKAMAAQFGTRGYIIHLGVVFGTIMAFNVWFRIWPAQRQIISAIKAGQAPDAALVGLAGTRSKHNTYMSVPLVLAMVGQHTVGWSASYDGWAWVGVILVGWALVWHLYGISKKVKGF